jgi:predicted TPR repeat methyltransferase
MAMEVRVDPLFQSSGDLLADRRYGFALELAGRGDRHGAIDVLTQAIELAPDFASAWFTLADLREVSGDRSGAIEAFRRAHVADPDDRRGARLRLARLNAQVPGAMPPDYVRALFDQYAPRFDTALEALSYRAPALLLDAITRSRARRGQRLRFGAVLDLGCGTGLMGAAVRPICDWLVGVDLSPGMIAKARQKGLYDRLDVADICEFMTAECSTSSRYHLILAADVLPYVGDLTQIMTQVKSLLEAGGLFGFTLETHAGTGIKLGEKLRYAHSEMHVRDAIASAGLALHVFEHASTRNEGSALVVNAVVLAGRS